MSTTKIACWVCNSKDLKLLKKSDINGDLNSQNFAITNFEYGKTGELWKCNSCNFIQAVDLDKVLSFYEDLEDTEYENGRKERKLQESKLVEVIKKYKPSGSLFDIGAGSGIMVEAAQDLGYDAEGVEPSKWLCEIGQKKGLKVHLGIYPHKDITSQFDIVSLVDVIEHVPNPGELLTDIKSVMKNDGYFVLVTPDVRSLMSRLLKYKWWHFRIAHIGYFNRKNLSYLLEKSGYTIIKIKRPTWYFTAHYLSVRALSFLPKFVRFKPPRFLEKIVVPVNLRDSLLVICQKNPAHA